MDRFDSQLRSADKQFRLFDKIADDLHKKGYKSDEIIVPFKFMFREYEASMYIRSADVTVQEVNYLPISTLSSTKMKFGFESDRLDVLSLYLLNIILI